MKYFLSLLFIFTTHDYLYSQSCFEVGSSKKEVRKAQGTPTSIHKYAPLGIEVWDYELSSITFKKGRTYEYANLDHNLRICEEVDTRTNTDDVQDLVNISPMAEDKLLQLAKKRTAELQAQGINTDILKTDNNIHSRFSDIPLNIDEVNIAKERGIDLSHITSSSDVAKLIANDKAQKQKEFLIFGIGILFVILIFVGIFLWIKKDK